MKKIYAIRWVETNKYDEEYDRHAFVSADRASEARSLAIESISMVETFECAHCGKHSPIGLDVIPMDDSEFWEIFETEDWTWEDTLMEWATDDTEMAAQLWAKATELDVYQILQLEPLRVLVEQYELDQAACEPQPCSDSTKPELGMRRSKSL
jgi:hypothetical protein